MDSSAMQWQGSLGENRSPRIRRFSRSHTTNESMTLLSKPDGETSEPDPARVERTSAGSSKASPRLWLMAFAAFAAYTCVNIFLAWTRQELDPTFRDPARDAA